LTIIDVINFFLFSYSFFYILFFFFKDDEDKDKDRKVEGTCSDVASNDPENDEDCLLVFI